MSAPKITVVPSQLRVKPGEQAVASIALRNLSEEVGHYRIHIDKLPDGYAEVAPDQVSAFPAQETRSEVTVHPPPDAMEVIYPAVVRVTLQDQPEVEAAAPLEVEILPGAQPARSQPSQPGETGPARVSRAEVPVTAEQIRVSVERLENPGLPPSAVQWRLELRNAGTVLDSYVFGFSGVPPGWVSLEPTEVTLRPNEAESGFALLTVQPPISCPAKTYTLTLQVFSVLNINQRTMVPLSFEVAPRAGFALSVMPPEAEAQGTREFKITLQSAAESNTDLQIDLSAADDENACEYTFALASIALPARQEASTMLRVRPKALLGVNERRTYRFKVTAVPRGRSSLAQSIEARLTQVAVPPPTLSLRPQVQSGELEGHYTLGITNPAAVNLALVLAASDAEAGCDYRFTQNQVLVAARGEAQIGLVVVSRGYTEAEKTTTFTVTATHEGELVPISKTDGRFIQKPVKPVSLSLVPNQQSSRGSARFYLKAYNPRSSMVQLRFAAEDDADALAFVFKPEMVQLSAGAEGGAWITVRPKDRLMSGEQRRVHRFKVNAAIEGITEPLAVAGVLAQVRGYDWQKTGKGVRKLIKWVIAIILVVFVIALALGGLEQLSITSPQVNAQLQPILNSAVARFIRRLPIARLARSIVIWVQSLIYSFTSGNI